MPIQFEPWSEELRGYMTEHLKDYLGVEKVIWVKEGIDPEETNGCFSQQLNLGFHD